MNEIRHLLAVADAYLAATDIRDVTLSHRLFGDSKKLAALRAGADITVSRFNGAIRWLSDNWPERAEWPVEIERPTECAGELHLAAPADADKGSLRA